MRGVGSDWDTPRVRADYVVVVVALVLGVVLLGGVVAVGGDQPLLAAGNDQQGAADREPLNTTAVERAVLAAVNRERTARGLETVEYDPRLAAVARTHSADMVSEGYYAHTGPGGDTAFDRVQSSSVSCSSVGENIAATWWQTSFETPGGERDSHTSVEQLADGLVEQWLSSPDHRRNMLSPYWEWTGVGVAVTAEGEVLVTQEFCA